MARYLLMIHDNEADYDASPTDARQALDRAHEKFASEHEALIVGGEHLYPSSTAAVVREDGHGGHLITDGPYAETKEAMGGYYMVDVPDLDAALAVAKRLPYFGVVGDAAVEVRRLYENE